MPRGLEPVEPKIVEDPLAGGIPINGARRHKITSRVRNI